MSVELEVAHDVQQSLLPHSFHQFRPLEVCGVNRPSLTVGGDYFDVMTLRPHYTAFVIADVCGKGLEASLVAAMLQGTFAAMTWEQKPEGVFAHVNRFLHARCAQRFATVFFAVLDTGGRIEFVNAGHLSPLLLHAGRVAPAFSSECLPLGLFSDAPFKASSSRIDAGDTLVLYTDGVIEAQNHNGDEFGIERLEGVVAQHGENSVEELQGRILAALEDFSHGVDQQDDITLLIVRYRGAK